VASGFSRKISILPLLVVRNDHDPVRERTRLLRWGFVFLDWFDDLLDRACARGLPQRLHLVRRKIVEHTRRDTELAAGSYGYPREERAVERQCLFDLAAAVQPCGDSQQRRRLIRRLVAALLVLRHHAHGPELLANEFLAIVSEAGKPALLDPPLRTHAPGLSVHVDDGGAVAEVERERPLGAAGHDRVPTLVDSYRPRRHVYSSRTRVAVKE
jgi:hypothetical protein